MGRKSGTGVRSAVLVTIGAFAGFGCDDVAEDTFYGPLVYDVLPGEVSGPFALEYAYADGEPWQFVDLDALGSPNGDIPGKVYVMRGVAGQYPIIDALPGGEGYSHMWRVVEVTPPSGYEANQIKSLQTIEDEKLSMTETDRLWHCPVVNPDAAWSTNLGVPIEALGLPAMPVQVIWNAGDDMPNAYNEYFSQFGVTAAEFFDFVATPQYEAVLDPETGEPVLDPETEEPVVQLVWPGFEFPPEFVALAEMRTDQPFITDADADALDIELQPVWHKTLRGFCLPDQRPGGGVFAPGDANGYSTVTDDFGDALVAVLGDLFVQFSPLVEAVEGDPDADPPVEPQPEVAPMPYGLLPIYGAVPGADDYAPVVEPQGVVTTSPEQVTDVADLDMANNLGPIADPVYRPLIRQVPMGTIVPEGM